MHRHLPILTLGVAGCLAADALAQQWTHLAGSPDRLALADETLGPIDSPAWSAAHDTQGDPIDFLGPASVLATDELTLALGESNSTLKLFAFDRATGQPAWEAPVHDPFLDSWSSPVLDSENHRAIVASGPALTCIDLNTGAVVWETSPGAFFVNSSPLVTHDLHPADRLFVTTYGDGYEPGSLLCVNVDPFDARSNPFEPGQIVWQLPMPGLAGNTPAYAKGVVYTTSNVDAAMDSGLLLAFPADALTPPDPLWSRQNPDGHPYFGSALVADDPCGTTAVYAASFEFHGGQLSANLLKLRATDGAVIWSTPAGRTNSTPILLPDGRIALSTGLQGFGSVPSVHLFDDECGSVSLLWDSALATWQDDNANGAMDPGEFLAIGGWNHQPAAAVSAQHTLFVGSPPTDGASFLEPFHDLRALDLDLHPTDDGFIQALSEGAGSSPAIADGSLFSVGPDGLIAFPPDCPADCNGDANANVLDLVCFAGLFQSGDPQADCNGDGLLNTLDFVCFQIAIKQGCP